MTVTAGAGDGMSDRADDLVRQQCAASLKLVDAAAAMCRSGLGPRRARPALYDWARETADDTDPTPPHGIPRPLWVVPS